MWEIESVKLAGGRNIKARQFLLTEPMQSLNISFSSHNNSAIHMPLQSIKRIVRRAPFQKDLQTSILSLSNNRQLN